MALRYRYSMWDGTQEVPALQAEDILDNLTDDLMNFGDLQHALRNLLQRGMRNPMGDRMQGLRDLLQQLRQQRRQQLDRFDLSSIFDDLKRQLEEILDMEQNTLDRRLEEAGGQPQGEQSPQGQQSPQGSAQQQPGQQSPQGQQGQQQPGQQGDQSEGSEGGQQGGQQQGASQQPGEFADMLRNIANKKKQFLSELPEDVPGQVKELQNYEFMDPEAQARFNELLESLKKAMMDTFFKDMYNQIANMSPEDMQRMKDMVRDLNQMLQDKMAGKEPNFDQFMQQYGDLFGDNPPQSLDELIQQMQHQRAKVDAVEIRLVGVRFDPVQRLRRVAYLTAHTGRQRFQGQTRLGLKGVVIADAQKRRHTVEQPANGTACDAAHVALDHGDQHRPRLIIRNQSARRLGNGKIPPHRLPQERHAASTRVLRRSVPAGQEHGSKRCQALVA